MVALCGAAAGMTTDQLWAGTLEVFGFTRRSAAQVGRLEAALELLLGFGSAQPAGGRRPDSVMRHRFGAVGSVPGDPHSVRRP